MEPTNPQPHQTSLPPGFGFFLSASETERKRRSIVFYRISVLVITFSAYAAFHASRKPPSIVKSVLITHELDKNEDTISARASASGWAPFDGESGPHRLGELDLAFLSTYAVGMYFAGHIGDRMDLRVFLTVGMFLSGVSTIFFGLGYWWQIHSLGFYMLIQIVNGLFQSIGWPCVVSVIGNWFGKSKRGLIMGVWNSQTSVGNILGSVLASSVLEFGWGWSFVIPGVFVIVVGVFVFMFLVVSPEVAGFEESPEPANGEIELSYQEVESSSFVIDSDDETSEKGQEKEEEKKIHLQTNKISRERDEEVENDEVGLVKSQSSSDSEEVVAVGFIEAWRLPGVAAYSFCLFFTKLVAYTFLYWLPFYIRHTSVAGKRLSHKTAGILSSVYDVGGVFGGILAGYLSDKIEARAVTSIMFLFFSIPVIIFYRVYGSISMFFTVSLMFLSGLLVNGPYSLITTAVSADLGTQNTKNGGNSRALATVTAIIDGTGSVGAALGPLLTGYISTRGWNSVFVMLIFAIIAAGLFLIQLAKAEVISKMNEKKWFWNRISG